MGSKIVITDGFTLNPGDLSWEPFSAFGEVTIYDRTSEQEILKRVSQADIIVTNKTPITKEVFVHAVALKLVAVTATGYNIVAIDAASKRKIPVCNVPGYGTDSVAQHTFALILELTNRAGLNSHSVNAGEWSNASDWSYSKAPIIELSGKTLGIVGYGKIGQKVAEIANAFGMKILFFNPTPKKSMGSQASIGEVFQKSDFVSLHCPLTSDNREFVNGDLLLQMKRTSYLINTARGQLINEMDLASALSSGKIAGAALDVLSKEPRQAGHPLIGLRNCIITPHNAWLSYEARKRIMDITFENIAQYLKGKPQNIVNLTGINS
jgi:glycerate dehydrogenase